MNKQAIAQAIINLIEEFELTEGAGYRVLTEAATGAYASTAVIAAVAGMETHALTKGSRWGSPTEAVSQTEELRLEVERLNGKPHIINYISRSSLPEKIDIVMNCGAVRPIDASIAEAMSSHSCVALMFEDWELRESDIKLNELRRRSIPIIATRETHPNLNIFHWVGLASIELINRCVENPSEKNILYLSNSPFHDDVKKALEANFPNTVSSPNYQLNFAKISEWLQNFLRSPAGKKIDGIFSCVYPFDKELLGIGGKYKIDLTEFTNREGRFLIRLCGGVGRELSEQNIAIYPAYLEPGHMAILLSEIGWEPILRLQAGSLRAALDFMLQKTRAEPFGAELRI